MQDNSLPPPSYNESQPSIGSLSRRGSLHDPKELQHPFINELKSFYDDSTFSMVNLLKYNSDVKSLYDSFILDSNNLYDVMILACREQNASGKFECNVKPGFWDIVLSHFYRISDDDVKTRFENEVFTNGFINNNSYCLERLIKSGVINGEKYILSVSELGAFALCDITNNSSGKKVFALSGSKSDIAIKFMIFAKNNIDTKDVEKDSESQQQPVREPQLTQAVEAAVAKDQEEVKSVNSQQEEKQNHANNNFLNRLMLMCGAMQLLGSSALQAAAPASAADLLYIKHIDSNSAAREKTEQVKSHSNGTVLGFMRSARN